MMNVLIAHPVMALYIVISFFLTTFFYIAPEFVSDNLTIQGELTAGTFIGTMIHKNYGHFFGNLLILIPIWIYSDKILGVGMTSMIVAANMVCTGIVVLIKGGSYCGASGINHMLLGVMGILGSYLLLIFSGVILFSEFRFIGSNDQVAHGVHILWQIIGVAGAVIFCIGLGIRGV